MKNIKSIRVLILACAGLVAVASIVKAGDTKVNFDQGVDIKSVVDDASFADIKIPEAKSGQLLDLTRDCKKITFSAAAPLASAEISLTSRETTQDCQNMGYPVGQICFPSTRYYHETVKLVITEPRILQPGQKEVFEVCLWGAFLNLKQVAPAYKYSVHQVPGSFELTPKGGALSVSSAKNAEYVKMARVANFSNKSPFIDADGGGWTSCSNTSEKWTMNEESFRTVKREGWEIYVCKFAVVKTCGWKNCNEAYPHTQPGQCYCKGLCRESSATNIGSCYWEQISRN